MHVYMEELGNRIGTEKQAGNKVNHSRCMPRVAAHCRSETGNASCTWCLRVMREWPRRHPHRHLINDKRERHGQLLAEASESAHQQRVESVTHLVEGQEVEAIFDCVIRNKADLLVFGIQQHSLYASLFSLAPYTKLRRIHRVVS